VATGGFRSICGGDAVEDEAGPPSPGRKRPDPLMMQPSGPRRRRTPRWPWRGPMSSGGRRRPDERDLGPAPRRPPRPFAWAPVCRSGLRRTNASTVPRDGGTEQKRSMWAPSPPPHRRCADAPSEHRRCCRSAGDAGLVGDDHDGIPARLKPREYSLSIFDNMFKEKLKLI